MKLLPQKWMLPRDLGDGWGRAGSEAEAPRRSGEQASEFRTTCCKAGRRGRRTWRAKRRGVPGRIQGEWLASERRNLGRRGPGSRRPGAGLGRRGTGEVAEAFTKDPQLVEIGTKLPGLLEEGDRSELLLP